MAVIELRVPLPAGSAAAVAETLAEAGEEILMVLEDQPSGAAWLTGYFASKGEALAAWSRVAGLIPEGAAAGMPELREMPDADWKESYKAHFKPWRFGPLHWVPVWEKETYRAPAGDSVIWLDPGMAFGTGNHETTRLCCERLVDFAAAHGTGADVIDAGCGSGILALSAARLGFKRVVAFDLDPVAIEVSRENVKLNGLQGGVEFLVGDLKSGLAGRRAGLVLANIQADVLACHARELAGAVAPGGQLVLSGILAGDLDAVRRAFEPFAWSGPAQSRAMGEWRDLAFTRPA